MPVSEMINFIYLQCPAQFADSTIAIANKLNRWTTYSAKGVEHTAITVLGA